MRGKHLDEIRKLANMRITPADAGKTESMESGVRYSWDHPPQVRGKPQHAIGQELLPGITPAGAGKT